MSSSMLKQAVVDANALKEAALKNAESLIIEKYSNKIKEAVENLLEQPEEEEEDELSLDDFGMGDEGEESKLADDIPLAATDGEKLCQCPDDEEEIEIDFGELEAQLMGDQGIDSGEMKDREGMSNELEVPEEDEEEELKLEENKEDLNEEEEIEEVCADKEKEKVEEDKEPLEEKEELSEEENKKELEEGCPASYKREEEDEDENIELYEEDLASLMEELNVDIEPVLNGNVGANSAEREEFENIQKAKEQDEVEDNESKDKNIEIQELNESLKKLDKKNENLIKENKQMKKMLLKFKDKIRETNLANSKLLYSNKVLENHSLNERQKQQLTEAIDRTESMEAAKATYEALQNVVGGQINKKRLPKSLREAVSRPSTLITKRSGDKEKKESLNESFKGRMQKLAGLK